MCGMSACRFCFFSCRVLFSWLMVFRVLEMGAERGYVPYAILASEAEWRDVVLSSLLQEVGREDAAMSKRSCSAG